MPAPGELFRFAQSDADIGKTFAKHEYLRLMSPTRVRSSRLRVEGGSAASPAFLANAATTKSLRAQGQPAKTSALNAKNCRCLDLIRAVAGKSTVNQRRIAMGIFTRLSNLIAANTHALLDRAEDPEVMLKQVVRDME